MSSIKLESNASGTGIFTIASPNSNTNRTLTLPDSTGTVVVTGGAQTIEFAAGSASTPSITTTGDTNTGIFFPAADTIAFAEGGTEVARFNSSGQFGIGVTPYRPLQVKTGDGTTALVLSPTTTTTGTVVRLDAANETGSGFSTLHLRAFETMFYGSSTERARITSGGSLLIGGTTLEPETNSNTDGIALSGTSGAYAQFAVNSKAVAAFNRMTTDGTIVSLRQAGTEEGTISVSGTTVSYNGGHLSRWAQMPGTKDDTLVKGTVMSNLDEMNVYTKDGEPVDNEQLNKVKVSDVEGDVNAAGVFVNWTYDDVHQVDEINMAMTGDMIIRIAQGVVVQKGDLLMSAGDGTAKPQGDDIVRSKTVAKVTSNHVTCTYADGSYCVPCVLMAC
jgi:hypothetical protein